MKIEDVYPLSDIEAGMVFFTLKNPAEGMYHNQFVYHFHIDAWDTPTLTKALQLLTVKHSILRTGFNVEDYEQPMHVVMDHVEFNIDVVDLLSFTTTDQDAIIQQYLKDDFNRPFNLKAPPLWRLTVFQRERRRFVIIWVVHHSILDGWSNASFIAELLSTYVALQTNASFVPQPLKSSYKQYVIDQITEHRKEENIAFWKEEISNFSRLTLAGLGDDNDKVSFYKQFFDLGEARLTSAKQMAAQHETSVKTLCITAYAVMLSMLSVDNDFVIGLVSHGRPVAEDSDKVLGCFLNTLPVRIHIPHEITWEQLIGQIHQKLVSLKRYEKMSLAKIKSLSPEASSSANPFFDSAFDFTNYHVFGQNGSLSGSSGNQPASALTGFERTNTLLDVDFSITNQQFSVCFSYSTTAISEDLINRLQHYLVAAIDKILFKSNEMVNKNLLLRPSERNFLQELGLGKTSNFDASATINDFLKQAASVDGERTAVAWEGKSLTYSQLHRQVSYAARVLRDMNVTKGRSIALLFDRSPDTVVAILAIWKVGCAYVPLSPQQSPKRWTQVLENAGCTLVVKHVKYATAETPQEVVTILSDQLILANDVGKDSDFSFAEPYDLAYILFTSGSTGIPKGAMIEHIGMMNHIHAKINDLELTEESIIVQNAPYTFDISVWQFFSSICCRGRTIIYSDDVVQQPEEFVRRLLFDKVTIVEVVPSYFELLFDEFKKWPCESFSLKYVLVTGEEVRLNLVEEWFRHFPNVKLVNAYGPTEASDDITHFIMSSPPAKGPVPIGKPIQNLSIYVLDNKNQLLPFGVTGEICVSGVGVGRGYINNKESTGNSFVTDPIAISENRRMYKTGDLGRWNKHGELLFLGRKDYQVKINGHRIELGEIENALCRIEKVNNAVAIIKNSVSGGKSICAYYTGPSEIDSMQLRSLLNEMLPLYMIPTQFVFLKKIPVKPNGKIDRSLLPEPLVLEQAATEPISDPVMNMLIEAWREVLNRDSISIHDNFFFIGGDSIKLILIQAKLKKKGLHVGMNDIFENPTILELSKRVRQNTTTVRTNLTVGTEIPLTPIQIQFLEEYRSNPHQYSQSMIFFSPNRIEEGVLKELVTLLQDHHDMLNVTFALENDRYVQRKSKVNALFQTFDGFESDESMNFSMLEEVKKAPSRLNIHNGPMMVISLFHGKDRDLIFVMVHHLIIDGVSWRVLMDDFQTLLLQKANAQSLQLPERSDSFLAWAESLHTYAQGEPLLSELPYWLAISQEKILPLKKDSIDREMPNVSESVLGYLDRSRTNDLLTVANQAYRTKALDILLSAFSMAVKEVFVQPRLVLSIESHGREQLSDHIDLTRTIGWFTSVFPLVLDVQDEIAKQVEYVKSVLHGVPNNGIGFGLLKYLSNHVRLNHIELRNDAEIVFNYLGELGGAEQDDSALPSTDTEGVHNPLPPDGNLSIEFNIVVVGGVLQVNIVYNAQFYSRDTISRLLDAYLRNLHEIIEHCCHHTGTELTISDLSDKDISSDELDLIKSLF